MRIMLNKCCWVFDLRIAGRIIGWNGIVVQVVILIIFVYFRTEIISSIRDGTSDRAPPMYMYPPPLYVPQQSVNTFPEHSEQEIEKLIAKTDLMRKEMEYKLKLQKPSYQIPHASHLTQIDLSRAPVAVYGVSIFLMVINLATNVLLIMGSSNEKAWYILPYLMLDMPAIVFWTIVAIEYPVFIVYVPLKIYLWIVVFSLFLSLKNQSHNTQGVVYFQPPVQRQIPA